MRTSEEVAQQGWVVAQRRRSHPGRFRTVMREENDALGVGSLPLVFLGGMVFEVFLSLRDQIAAERTLNWGTVVCVGLWVAFRVRRRSLRMTDPLLLAGATVLLAGALLRLTGLLPSLLLELTIKTLGVVLIVFSLDRMERRRTNERLRNSEEYLESIFESIPDPLCNLGEHGKILAANRNALNTFGEAILGQRCCVAYLGHERCASLGALDCSVGEVWERRKPRFEIVRDESGARRYEVTTYPIFGRRGFAGKLIQQIRDVSSQVEVEDEASLMTDAVNSVKDSVLVLGLRGELLQRNRAAEQWVGVDPVGAEPRSAEDLLPFQQSEDQDAFLAALRDFEPVTRDVVFSRPDGEQRTMNLSLSPIRALDDRLLGTVVLLRDVTEVRTLQQSLLQNEKLSALGLLVSGVAHELNNPLTAVLGYSQLLLALDLDEELKRQVRSIYTHADRCRHIIEGLLRFSRQSRGERHQSNLNDMVRGALEFVSYQRNVGEIQIETDLDPAIPDSMMDAAQLQQVMVNLVTNSQHAMESTDRPGKILVRTSLDRDGNAVLEITDNGCGIPKALRSKIFDPFFTTKGIGKGTGLGLSVSYGIVQDHGGRMSVQSEVGRGTTFRIVLPIVVPPEVLGREHFLHKAGSRPEARYKVLVVDDEPSVLLVLEELLRGDGHEVRCADSGARALEILGREPVDVMFTDWRMPGMGGDELYRRVVESHPDLDGRIVFTTGDTLDPEVARLAEAGDNHLLSKPFHLETIREVLGRIEARTVHPC